MPLEGVWHPTGRGNPPPSRVQDIKTRQAWKQSTAWLFRATMDVRQDYIQTQTEEGYIFNIWELKESLSHKRMERRGKNGDKRMERCGKNGDALFNIPCARPFDEASGFLKLKDFQGSAHREGSTEQRCPDDLLAAKHLELVGRLCDKKDVRSARFWATCGLARIMSEWGHSVPRSLHKYPGHGP